MSVTLEHFDNLGVKSISNAEEFEEVLLLDKAIIYFLVEWSGPERESRSVVYKALSEITRKEIPLFKIDCSEQNQSYVEEWLRQQKGEYNYTFNYCYTLVPLPSTVAVHKSYPAQHLYRNGFGEILLLEKGTLVKFLTYPGRLGFAGTKHKLESWVLKD